MKMPYVLVDAFAAEPLTGNPCAVFFDADSLDRRQMQALALEMNLSESAFVQRSSVADFKARYFTPAEEIPLAGHPTIATTWALIDSGRVPSDATTVSLELIEGPINVAIGRQAGGLPQITMAQRRPKFLAVHESRKVMPLFGLTEHDLLPDCPIQTVSTGTPQLMVPLRDHDALRRASVDAAAYTAYRNASDFFSPHLFCLRGFTELGDTSARHFGVPPDTTEDPFTGSATGGMAAYLWRYRLIDKPIFVAEQGHWMGRPGVGKAEVIGDREAIASVRVGGTAVTIIRGVCEI
jgi:trans-2,3-dihydro-3-hydroxyanthranilate isomerase